MSKSWCKRSSSNCRRERDNLRDKVKKLQKKLGDALVKEVISAQNSLKEKMNDVNYTIVLSENKEEEFNMC